ncbi:ABI3 protein, partial [Orthonyx spaldingii]|nr:ABI3 protein [Orthonyx spaldingii]
ERLRQSDIPEGRRLLRDQHGNLHRVAEYCHSNYLQASDKRKALEETMALSTQSLASVTYQVSSLASAFLRLLDLQAAQLRQVEADVACVAQVGPSSTRGLGKGLFPSYQKIVAPPSPPVLEPYYRKPLNFSVLDDIGHGIKDTSTQLSRTGTLARKSTKSCSAQAAGTLGRSSRAPEPVQPPVVPEGKLSAASSSSSLVSLRCRGESPGQAPMLPRGFGGKGKGLGDLLPWQCSGPEQKYPLRERGNDAGNPAPGGAAAPRCPGGSMRPPVPPAVVALYPYTPQKDNELSLEPGALLFVTRRYSDGWCEGLLGPDSAPGFFPGNYVEPF